MFSKIILKNTSNEIDKPLSQVKKTNLKETNDISKYSYLMDNYCGECKFLNWHTNKCSKYNLTVNTLDLSCKKYFKPL